MLAFNKQNQRKQQKTVLQPNNPRTTRQQFDSKNNSRQTLNSKNKTLLTIDEQTVIKKKTKNPTLWKYKSRDSIKQRN